MTSSLCVCLWLSCSKTLESLTLIEVSISINFNFSCALLCVAKRLRVLIKEDTRCRESELKRKMGSGFSGLDETETDIERCFPIYFVVSVSLYVSSSTQIDSISNIAKFLNSAHFSMGY